ncbi:MAG: hypothetical protein JEZ03_15700 [Bacteroidales bacterium]|nr:hypothetical protein [Bacteroidales bacterium]
MIKNIYYFIAVLLTLSIASCTKSGESAMDNMGMSDGSGRGGSLARFAVVDDYLYTVDQSNMNVFDISDANHPKIEKDVNIGWQIETLFPTDSLLYIGAQDGMYIYSIKDPMRPKFISKYQHITSCDPVVGRGQYAFVTLSTDSWCGNMTNQMEVIDLSNIYKPEKLKEYQMNNPKGLATKGDLLFVCDEGLKVFDASNVNDIKQIDYFSIEAMDVIALDDVLLVIGSNGLYQYAYSQGNDLDLLSHIQVGN